MDPSTTFGEAPVFCCISKFSPLHSLAHQRPRSPLLHNDALAPQDPAVESLMGYLEVAMACAKRLPRSDGWPLKDFSDQWLPYTPFPAALVPNAPTLLVCHAAPAPVRPPGSWLPSWLLGHADTGQAPPPCTRPWSWRSPRGSSRTLPRRIKLLPKTACIRGNEHRGVHGTEGFWLFFFFPSGLLDFSPSDPPCCHRSCASPMVVFVTPNGSWRWVPTETCQRFFFDSRRPGHGNKGSSQTHTDKHTRPPQPPGGQGALPACPRRWRRRAAPCGGARRRRRMWPRCCTSWPFAGSSAAVCPIAFLPVII